MIDGPYFALLHEPYKRRRFWPADRRARRAAEEALGAGSPRPDRFVVVVQAGLRHNSTSVGQFLVGHIAGVITHLGRVG